MNELHFRLMTLAALFLVLTVPQTLTGQDTGWQLDITGEDTAGNTQVLGIGTSDQATDGYDADLDRFAPPAPPNGSFDLRIVDNGDDYFRQIRPLTTVTTTWTLSGRPSAEDEFITLTWDPSGLSGAAGSFLLEHSNSGETVEVDMAETGSVQLDTGEQSVTITHVVQQTITGEYAEGWQLIGYPAETEGTDPFTVFSNAIPGTFFTHQGSYIEPESLAPGKGYWIRLSEAETIEIEPPFFTETTLSFEPGWYLISGPGVEIPFSSILNSGAEFVAGSLTEYDSGGYSEADTLRPGQGYWVQSEGTFDFDLSNSYSSQSKQQAAKQQLATPDGFTEFRIRNEDHNPLTFFLGEALDSGTVNPLSFSMPPMPPNGAFDVRYTNDSRIATSGAGTLRIQSPGESLMLSYPDAESDIPLEFEIFREGADEGQRVVLAPGEEQSVEGAGISEIGVALGVINSNEPGSERPNRLELAQNYPNPFNPVTVIGYSLPQASEVSIEIFDMTGRRVAVLSEGVQSAGRHTAEFDASDLSSGVYMYRLQSAGSVLTRKMTLIK